MTERLLDAVKEAKETYVPIESGAPKFFRAAVYAASSGLKEPTFRTVGIELVSHIGEMLEGSRIGFLDSGRRFQQLMEYLAEGQDQNVWVWFERECPTCMELIPPEKRGEFIAGVMEAYQRGAI